MVFGIMNLFFEEDGSFKAGTILSEVGNAYQVELPTGRRTKVKANHVFFKFESPSSQTLFAQGLELLDEIDPNFLWEVAPSTDFTYTDIAREYWGGEPTPEQLVAILLGLHNHPIYFYKKGRGTYRRAPEETLKLALIAQERKRVQEEKRKAMVEEMKEGRLPEDIAQKALTLLVSPDKNSMEYRALMDAASECRLSPLRLMLSLGAIKSEWHWFVDSFYATNFPKGRDFPASLPQPEGLDFEALPIADVVAFSIDDSDTTEIDDAVSVTHLDNGTTRVGIHIAAPAIAILRDDPVDVAARARMSTVYAPGLKTTMLPKSWISAFSLDEGKLVPCLSLYVYVNDETLSIERSETHLERICVQTNIRYDQVESLYSEEAVQAKTVQSPHSQEICWLWPFAKKLLADREAISGRPMQQGIVDWFFALEGDDENAKIALKCRRRGAPLDLVVAELMILANSTWGLWLEEHDAPAIYRGQRMGRPRMTTVPTPHDGLGVERYAWSSSPLRRYVDLVNQRQMISVLRGQAPVYGRTESDLFQIVSQFEALHTLYGDFQNRMDRYWSLRWIMQEGLKEIEAVVVKGEVVRIDGLPFMQRLPGIPDNLERGRKLLLRVISCDLTELVMQAQLVKVLTETATLVSETEEASLDEDVGLPTPDDVTVQATDDAPVNDATNTTPHAS